jgi:hypothetical protein
LHLRVPDLGDTLPINSPPRAYPSEGKVVKHRQLACQVGVFIKHPSENSIASFSFICTMLDEGTTFIFGSWICVANGSGGFNSHLADSRKPEAFAATRQSNLNKFIDNLDEFCTPISLMRLR